MSGLIKIEVTDRFPIKKRLFWILKYEILNYWNWNIRFLGIKLFGQEYKNHFLIKRFLGVKKRICAEEILRQIHKIAKLSNTGVKDVYVLLNNMGETFLFLCSIAGMVKKRNDIKFICTKHYHKQLVSLCIGEDYICEGDSFLAFPNVGNLDKVDFNVDEINYSIALPIGYFEDYERCIRNEVNCKSIPHFYENYINQFNKLKKIDFINPVTENRFIDLKLKSLNITKPFVLICNETYSNENLSDEFYLELTLRVRELGYDVLFNSFRKTRASEYGTVFFPSLKEVFDIASVASVIIGIRSGLMDVLAAASRHKMFVLYTDFRERSRFPRIEARRIHEAFTLKKINPYSSKDITEIVVDEKYNATKKLINEIVEKVAYAN